MQYVVVKPFAFAGDVYNPGDVFVPSKYPHTCDSRKLARLVSTRRIVEDFKIPAKVVEAPVEAPAKDAETSPQEAASASETESVKRSKGGK